MKVTDITPGLVYAVPANRMSATRRGIGSYGIGAAAQVRDGQIAVPFMVHAVGKFRRRQSGACTTEIVNDYHTTTVLGSFPDIVAMLGKNLPENKYKSTGGWRRRAGHHVANSKWPGYPSGIGVHGKKMKWQGESDIVSPVDIIMPWADFLTRREERVFVANEVEAYNARLSELRKQVHDMVGPVMGGHASLQHTVKTAVNMRVPSGQRLVYDHPQLMFEQTYDVQLVLTDLPPDVRRVLDPLLKEMAAIQKKLECAV